MIHRPACVSAPPLRHIATSSPQSSRQGFTNTLQLQSKTCTEICGQRCRHLFFFVVNHKLHFFPALAHPDTNVTFISLFTFFIYSLIQQTVKLKANSHGDAKFSLKGPVCKIWLDLFICFFLNWQTPNRLPINTLLIVALQ